MEKIKVKDIKKHLPLHARIKISGKIAFGVTKNAFAKIKEHYALQKTKLNEFVAPEMLAEIKEEKANLKTLIGGMQQEDRFRIGDQKPYLDAMSQKLSKLNKKQIKINKKENLGIFAIAPTAIKKFYKAKNDLMLTKLKESRETIKEKIETQKENIQNIKLQATKLQLEQKHSELLREIAEFEKNNGIKVNLENHLNLPSFGSNLSLEEAASSRTL